MAKSFIEELTGYRVKVQKDGKEVLNVPGILAFPLLLAAPKAGILGMAAAPLLGCSIHLENETGKDVDFGKAVKNAADTFVNTGVHPTLVAFVTRISPSRISWINLKTQRPTT